MEVNLPLQKPAADGAPPATLALELLMAFVAGLILNVMPCVLPVIALKALGFVNQSKEAPGRVRRLGWVYGAGVLASFLLLAGLAIGTQRAGGAAGWGDALRHPQFRVALTVLMTLIALNLFGVFEVTLGAGVMGPAAGLASRHGYGGAFCNGVLATVLATPCTAPFLAGALAFAFTQPPVVTLLVFLAVGTGLAFPFVLVCCATAPAQGAAQARRLDGKIQNRHGLSHAGDGALAGLRVNPQPGRHAGAGALSGGAGAGGLDLGAIRATRNTPKRAGRGRVRFAAGGGWLRVSAQRLQNRA